MGLGPGLTPLPAPSRASSPGQPRFVSRDARTRLVSLDFPSALRCQAPRSFRSRGSSPPQRFSPPGLRRSIAPCSRSWGSPRSTSLTHENALVRKRVSATPDPSELSPPQQLLPRHRETLPSCRFTTLAFPSRPPSVLEVRSLPRSPRHRPFPSASGMSRQLPVTSVRLVPLPRFPLPGPAWPVRPSRRSTSRLYPLKSPLRPTPVSGGGAPVALLGFHSPSSRSEDPSVGIVDVKERSEVPLGRLRIVMPGCRGSHMHAPCQLSRNGISGT